ATVLPEAKGNPRIMPGTWGLAAGKRTIVGTGYMSMAATSDFGKTFLGFGMWGAFKDDPRGRFQTHHLDPVYCGDASGRFLALGDNRGESGPKFGHLFASDDLGKTWKWLAPKGLDAASGRGAMVCNGSLLLMTDQGAENAWISADAGETWSGPFPTGTKRAVLSVVGDEFWLSGKPSRASADG
ncbi:MAG: exo-alpha-sialidase, partial [Verrucomicrobiae bacterium]|nr:exo-alpha-sialidase [Verrucomicrobiae bacterium]